MNNNNELDKFLNFLKTILIILIILLITCVVIVEFDYIYRFTHKEEYDVKDVNRDGKVSSIDYSIIKAYLMNKEVSNE